MWSTTFAPAAPPGASGHIIITGTAVMFTGNEPSNALHSLQAILTIPEFLWELFLGIYCTIWGFRTDAPILSGSAT